MLIVVASRYDEVARSLAARWDARLLTPADLSAPGWHWSPLIPQSGVAIASGQRVSTREITGVLTRLPTVYEEELEHVHEEDRAYVASEVTAFLLAWLSSLRCPMLNPPVPECLCGPAWRTERWFALASRQGIPVQPIHRDSTVEFSAGSPAEGVPLTAVTVVGERSFGPVHASLAEQARQLASAAGVELLVVRFTGPECGSRFVNADPCPDLSAPEVAEAVLHWFIKAGTC